MSSNCRLVHSANKDITHIANGFDSIRKSLTANQILTWSLDSWHANAFDIKWKETITIFSQSFGVKRSILVESKVFLFREINAIRRIVSDTSAIIDRNLHFSHNDIAWQL